MNSKAKVVVAVICLVAAVVVIAMNMGLFGGSKSRPGTSGAGAPSTASADQPDASGDSSEQAGLLKPDRH